MNPEEQHEVQKPDFEGAEMKYPQNSQIEPAEPANKLVSGPVLLFLALLLIAVLAGMYYWFMTLSNPNEPAPAPAAAERPTAAENNEPESTTAEVQTESLQVLSTSDEIDAIEADLESTDLDELDTELTTIEAELEAETAAQ